LNKKGQISFELLLLILFVFGLGLMISGYHFEEQDTTNAMLIAKSEMLSELNNANKFVYIDTPIQVTNSASENVEVGIHLSDDPEIDIPNTEIRIENTIIANTGFITANVDITY